MHARLTAVLSLFALTVTCTPFGGPPVDAAQAFARVRLSFST